MADALALSAREFVGVTAQVRRIKANRDKEPLHAVLDLGLAADLINAHGIGHDVAHRATGVQRRVGVLKHQLHISPLRTKLTSAEVGQYDPVKFNFARRHGQQLDRQRASVDLPQPDSPTMPSVSPCRTSSDTPLTAWVTDRVPSFLPREEKLFTTSVARSNTSSLMTSLDLRSSES